MNRAWLSLAFCAVALVLLPHLAPASTAQPGDALAPTPASPTGTPDPTHCTVPPLIVPGETFTVTVLNAAYLPVPSAQVLLSFAAMPGFDPCSLSPCTGCYWAPETQTLWTLTDQFGNASFPITTLYEGDCFAVPAFVNSFSIGVSQLCPAPTSRTEYYRYVMGGGADTALVVVASYDTVAMELTAEIRESPLGTAVQTAPLYWDDGRLVGTVLVSLTGADTEIISLVSHFDGTSPAALCQSDTLALDVAVPVSAEASVTVTGKVTTEATTEVGPSPKAEAKTSAELTVEVTNGPTEVQLTAAVSTVTGLEPRVEASGSAELSLLDGLLSLLVKMIRGVDFRGNDYLKGDFSITASKEGASITLESGVEKGNQGTEGEASLKLSQDLGSDLEAVAEAGVDGIGSVTGARAWGMLGLNTRLLDNLSLGLGVWVDGQDKEMSVKPAISLGLAFSRTDDGSPIELANAYEEWLVAEATAESCWPDTSECVQHPVLTAAYPWSEDQSYEVAVAYSFNPSDPFAMERSVEVRPVATGPSLAVPSGAWYADAFPANETAGLPGVPAAFDTCAAHVFTGYNTAPMTGDESRFVVPGDSCVFSVTDAPDEAARADVVFRILPGPGNCVTPGNRASGLRQVPTSTTPAVPGDGSFWGQYMAAPGPFAKGDHATGWAPDTWNSVRVDTVERNLFPVDGRAENLSLVDPRCWQTTIHEEDPRFATLGIPKNRCFLVDTAGALDHTNITCSTVPAWLAALPQSYTGWDGQQQSREYTKIFPDGLFTPGTHVEYFLRLSAVGSDTQLVMLPDTNRICPQGGSDFDGHRWQEFSVLPDRWKDPIYGGLGGACMLAVDHNDRGGEERAFIGVNDSIGGTAPARHGAHNGWYCTGAYVAPDGTHDYTGDDVGALGQYDAGGGMAPGRIAIYGHGGSPGSFFDLYQVRAPELSTRSANRIGDRLANRADMGLLAGKEGRHGPTQEMLRTYYKVIYLMSGDLKESVLGPGCDQGSDDIGLLTDFLANGASVSSPRGLWVMGNGFVEGEHASGGEHGTFLADYLACGLRHPSYCGLSGNVEPFPDLTTTSVVSAEARVLSVESGTGTACGPRTADVLEVNAAVPGATAASHYEDVGGNGPYVAGVFAPATTAHPFVTLVDGYALKSLRSRDGGSSIGRLLYFVDVLPNVFGSICPFTPAPLIDVPEQGARTVDFLSDVWGNPVAAGGVATVRFGLARADRVEVKVYDVTGRLVRVLADREFAAGEHSLTWDGTGDDGRALARGVYFTQVRYRDSGFVGARKLTILR